MALTLNGSNNTIAGLAVGGLPDGIVDADMIGAKAATAGKLANGAIIQVQNSILTTHLTVSSSWLDVITCSITPTAATNNILITCSIYASCSDAAMLALYRDSAKIGAGTDGDSADERGFAMVRDSATNEGDSYVTTFLDDISTGSAWSSGAITYRVKGKRDSSTDMYINRRSSATNYGLTSTMTLMEVVA